MAFANDHDGALGHATSAIEKKHVNMNDSDVRLPSHANTMLGSPSANASTNVFDDKTTAVSRSSKPPSMVYASSSSSTLVSVLLVATMTTTMLVNVANTTSVSISIPTMGRELGLDEGDLQWMASVYPLSSGCLLLVFGRVADLYGRKKVFLAGTAFLTVFTLVCAFPSDIVALTVLRAIQGLGAAATIPASVGIISHHFPPGKARSWAFATFSAGAPVGGIFGSAVGGVLTEYTAKTWRSPYYLMAGITFLSLLCGMYCVDRDKMSTETDKRIDWLGAFIVTAGLVLIVFVLGQGELAPNKWATPYIIALLIVGVILVGIFLYWQHYLEKIQDDANAPYSIWTPPPLMRMGIWTRGNGRFSAMMAIAILEWCSFNGWCFWVQLYYQNYHGLSPMETVLRLLPMSVTGIICNLFVGLFISRISVVWLLVSGIVCTSVSALLFALIIPDASYWAFGFPAAVLTVIGADFVFSAGTIYVARVALPEEQSVAGGLFNTMTQLGTAIGITVATVVYNSINAKNGPEADKLPAYQGSQWASFAFGVLGAVIALVCFYGVGIVGDKIPRAADVEETAQVEKDTQVLQTEVASAAKKNDI